MRDVPVNRVAPAVAAPPQDQAWSLRVAGWYIRVDRADAPAVLPGAGVISPSRHAQDSRPAPAAARRLSPYDALIAQHAAAEGFDWRLVAALIFEESRFQPDSRSDRGAYGLMQVRSIAAQSVGAEHFQAPDDNVQAGVRYLRQLEGMFAAARGRDRLSLVLAAYNMGPGHVRDAQALARELGYDPDRWAGHVEAVLPLLEDPDVASQLPNGVAKGRETAVYVRRILERYAEYRGASHLAFADDAAGDAFASSAP